MVEGKRSRGRQPKHGRDNICEWSGHTIKTKRQISHVRVHSAVGGDVKWDDEIPVVNVMFGYSHMKWTGLEEHGVSGTGQRDTMAR